ncbi:MAG: zinc finger domain-containing protein, partial [Trebonia sp.]
TPAESTDGDPEMTVNTITAAPAVRARQCPLCEAAPGEACQPKPAGDHLARYLDAFTAGQLTKAYMAMVLGELVVVDACVIVTEAAR